MTQDAREPIMKDGIFLRVFKDGRFVYERIDNRDGCMRFVFGDQEIDVQFDRLWLGVSTPVGRWVARPLAVNTITLATEPL